jgi:hypothetical protein
VVGVAAIQAHREQGGFDILVPPLFLPQEEEETLPATPAAWKISFGATVPPFSSSEFMRRSAV